MMCDQTSLDSIQGTSTFSSYQSIDRAEDLHSATTVESYDTTKQSWIDKEADASYFYTNKNSSFFRKTVFAIGTGIPPTPERPDARINSVMTPAMALETFSDCLDNYEKREIKGCKLVSHVGSAAEKDKIRTYFKKHKTFDDVLGGYYILPHDHLYYRYEILKELHNGRMSQIVLVYDHERCQKVAAKIFRNEQWPRICAKKEINMFWTMLSKEKDALSLSAFCAKKYICSILNHFQFRGHYVLVMEKCSRTIRSLLDHNVQFSFFKICNTVRQMCCALQFLHKLQLIHGSVCPQHVVQTNEKPFQIRLIDFSYSCIEKECKLPLHFPEGKQNYAAPELLLGRRYGKPADIWGLACLVVEMITRDTLFKGDTDTSVMVNIASLLGDISPNLIVAERDSKSVKRPEQPYFSKNGTFNFEGKVVVRQNLKDVIPREMFIEPVKSFLKSSLVYNPSRRPTVTNLVQSFIKPSPSKTPMAAIHSNNSASISNGPSSTRRLTPNSLGAKRPVLSTDANETPRCKRAKLTLDILQR